MHFVASHSYAPHELTGAVEHAPAPLQNDVAVYAVPVHDSAAQIVDVPGGAPHFVRSLPSHFAWHAPVPVHAGLPGRGSPLIAVQVPTTPPTLQASHWPVHAELQHTPSAQEPDPHSDALEQLSPIGFAQVPVLVAAQLRPVAQLAVLQQTPSTQWVLVHSESSPQAVPSAPVLTHWLLALQK